MTNYSQVNAFLAALCTNPVCLLILSYFFCRNLETQGLVWLGSLLLVSRLFRRCPPLLCSRFPRIIFCRHIRRHLKIGQLQIACSQHVKLACTPAQSLRVRQEYAPHNAYWHALGSRCMWVRCENIEIDWAVKYFLQVNYINMTLLFSRSFLFNIRRIYDIDLHSWNYEIQRRQNSGTWFTRCVSYFNGLLSAPLLIESARNFVPKFVYIFSPARRPSCKCIVRIIL